MPKKINQQFQSPKGMPDILPEAQPYWEKFRRISKEVAENFGFSRLDTPLLEETELFIRGTGEVTDIVDKQMYTLKTKGGKSLALRPEATPGIIRSYLQNGMASLSPPVKLYYCGPMFRYEQPQSGRFRQFHQFGLETI